jgi:hypothetical protein
MKTFPDPQCGQYGSVQSYFSRVISVLVVDPPPALVGEAFVFFGLIAILLYLK